MWLKVYTMYKQTYERTKRRTFAITVRPALKLCLWTKPWRSWLLVIEFRNFSEKYKPCVIASSWIEYSFLVRRFIEPNLLQEEITPLAQSSETDFATAAATNAWTKAASLKPKNQVIFCRSHIDSSFVLAYKYWSVLPVQIFW